MSFHFQNLVLFQNVLSFSKCERFCECCFSVPMDNRVIQINKIKKDLINQYPDFGFDYSYYMIDDYNYYEVGFKSDFMTFENPWRFCEIGLA